MPSPDRLGCDSVRDPAHKPHQERWVDVTEAGAGQLGLVALRQLRLAGIKDRTIRQATEDGRLIPYRSRVFLLPGAPPHPRHPLMAAILAVGPCCAASHRSAAGIYVCPSVAPPPLPEITLFGGNTLRMTGISRHRSDFLDPADLTICENIPVTSPARTLVDLGRYLSPSMLAKTMRYLLRSHLASLEELEACLERIGGRGRPGTVWLRILFAERRLGAPLGENEFEAEVGRALRNHGVPPGVEQFQVIVGRRVFVLDRAWPERKVGLNVDGDIHLLEEVADHDADRRNLLTTAGWRMFDARHHTNLAELAQQILGALR